MPPPYKNLIPFFFGGDPDDEGELEDPIKFIEDVKSTIDLRRHTDETKRPIATGVIFRLHLKGNASLWYQNLSPNIRTNWNHLEAAFLSRFKIQPYKTTDPNRFFNLLYNLRQNGRTIPEYIEEGDQLSSQCPVRFRRSLGGSFVMGLDEGRKINLALYYLRNKKNISYAQAKHAVIKAHQPIARQNPSDTVRNYLPPKPSTSVTQSDLVASSQGPKKLPSLQPRDNALYRPLVTSENPTDRIQADRGIYYNHCPEEGRYSISCTKPVASSAQREASRLGINMLQEVPRQYLQSLNKAQLHPQSLNQAHQYSQSPYQAHQYSRILNQAHQYPQSPNQAHQYPQSLNQAHRYPQSLYQDYQYPQSLHHHKYPQSPSEAHQYPQSLNQAYQYPQSLHQDHQYPQSPNQAYQYPQSPNEAHQYPQSLNQAINTPRASNRPINTPRALIRRVDTPRQHL